LELKSDLEDILNAFYIKSLQLNNFRNHEEWLGNFGLEANVITGSNGIGKTSLMDAIYYLSIGKSAFAGSDREVLQQGKTFFRVAGIFVEDDQDRKIVLKYNDGRKTLEVEGKANTKIREYIGKYPSVCISPKDNLIIIQGSVPRRKLIDQTLSQQDRVYMNSIVQYKRLLRQRNEALKTFSKKGNYDPALIRSFNEQMIPLGQNIFEKRTAFAEQLSELFKQFYAKISSDKESCHVEYQSQLQTDSFEYLLERNMEKDRFSVKTNAGIHRDDLKLIINEQSLRTFGSQGQQKSFIMALKLAQYEWLRKHSGKDPILMLDDIFDKLDHGRVNHLIHLLKDQWKGQIFITDTDHNRIPEILKENQMGFKQIKLGAE